MENKDNDIRINIRESRFDISETDWVPPVSFCGCSRCIESAYNGTYVPQIQLDFLYRENRMNELLNNLNYLFNYDQNDFQSDFINSLFQEASALRELERNDNVVIDVNCKRFADIEKTFTNCSICSDDYNDDDTVSTLNCKHVFHKNCIEEWGHYNPVCPVCKATIKTK